MRLSLPVTLPSEGVTVRRHVALPRGVSVAVQQGRSRQCPGSVVVNPQFSLQSLEKMTLLFSFFVFETWIRSEKCVKVRK